MSNNSSGMKTDSIQNIRFIEEIIDGMYDWVRVLDRDDNIIYMNKSMREGLKGAALGEKCYRIIGRSEPCENCISRKAVFEGNPHQKEEIIDGKIFSVMSSPIRDLQGEAVAVVEVLRDITQMKKLQDKIMMQNSKLQADLDIARKLQCSLLPRSFFEDKLDFSFIYKPCEALGGDFLDIFKIDDTHIGIYIADVSGHGVSASMLTVFLRSTINKKTLSPAQALKELYKEFNENNFDQNLYITIFYAIIDLENYSITYSNAGHNVCPAVFGKDRFDLLNFPGIPISNWLKIPGYNDRIVPLNKGDRIFFCTDGIIELRGANEEQFGVERLLAVILNDSSGPSGTLGRVIDAACQFAGISDFSELRDDITMALIKLK